ncbi:MAG: sigma-70 family RNA polymerase sigma factor [Nitrospirota bacterium]|jgi:RNA polymerase sigma-70 factor (ECF subfamily)
MSDTELNFQDIYSTFHPKMLHYLTRLVGEREAEDLTQEVFMKVNQALEGFRGESSFSTWIYRIATNAALDRQRSPSFQRTVRDRSTEERAAETADMDVWTGQKMISFDRQLIRTEMNECIRDFIFRLPADYRTVVILKEIEGFKNREVAEILGVSLDTVKIRLHRARARLKREFEAHCSFYRDERNVFSCDLKTALRDFKEST